jgi:D-sedoheptulose 7-phosphate isomerase
MTESEKGVGVAGLRELAEVAFRTADTLEGEIQKLVDLVVEVIRGGGRLFFCGNGGSAADAQHLAAEIVGRFYLERPALPAISLTVDTSILTAVANDYGFDQVFARQVLGLAAPADLLVGISTSGSSKNVVAAFQAGRSVGCRILGLTGRRLGTMDELCDCLVKVPSEDTPRIQEGHAIVVHLLAQLAEAAMAGGNR